ncbi:hypothetical protein [Microbacterium elymi]|uniref:Acetate kinase n=1 Tax=Microbacterium elymi TaxID=2909587 RepID=A0ABY5NNG7_9MICO|nr:hypothetical protein [Microbacterium elymi]UUT36685.1 hypothetical protein L2X98_31840 [Microbacterium elymi]
MNKRSGLKGLSGFSDMRDVLAGRVRGMRHPPSRSTCTCTGLRTYAGAYLAQLGGADVISFTAGVGENAPEVRAGALATLGFAGVQVDAERNGERGRGIRIISTDASAVTVLVVPTNEELEIARQTLQVTGG